jgi:hypothetical protein
MTWYWPEGWNFFQVALAWLSLVTMTFIGLWIVGYGACRWLSIVKTEWQIADVIKRLEQDAELRKQFMMERWEWEHRSRAFGSGDLDRSDIPLIARDASERVLRKQTLEHERWNKERHLL